MAISHTAFFGVFSSAYMKNAFIIILLLSAICVNAQVKCPFKVDKDKILADRNLDYFINRIKSDSFEISKNKYRMPSYLREQLACLIGDTLIANPGESWNSSDVYEAGPEVRRQLVFYAKSKDIVVFVYHIGGIAVTTRMIFMLFWDKRLVDLWEGHCDYYVKNLKDILKYIEMERKSKYGLHSGYVSLRDN